MAALPYAAWGQSLWPNYPNSGVVAVTGTGNVGIGYPYPSMKLQVASTDGNTAFGVTDPNGAFRFAMNTLSTGDGWTLYDYSKNAWHLGIAQTGGYVGVGTASPQHLLHVAGTIGAEEVIVSSTGADYVFDPAYKLAPLGEVARYIEANHHLPDIPSAEEVKRKGMGVGEMEAKLLAKVEELTLHMIEAEKINRQLRDRVTRLEADAAAAAQK